jgi:hypothetical protein
MNNKAKVQEESISINTYKSDDENAFLHTRHIMIISGYPDDFRQDVTVKEMDYVSANFCGTVIDLRLLSTNDAHAAADAVSLLRERDGDAYTPLVYICGDVQPCLDVVIAAETKIRTVKIIKGPRLVKAFVRGAAKCPPDFKLEFIGLGEVPINIHNVGVLFRKFFGSLDGSQTCSYFDRISSEHEFQSLQESSKPSLAYRTGIYLTPVERCAATTGAKACINGGDGGGDDGGGDDGDDGGGDDGGGDDGGDGGGDMRFRLLRCSTNLSGPTDNFRAADHDVVGGVNSIAGHFFENPVELNHVLAQVYHNPVDTVSQKEKKAKIKQHSDKTKDMPKDAVMAFCTFYDGIFNGPWEVAYDGDSRAVKLYGCDTIAALLSDEGGGGDQGGGGTKDEGSRDDDHDSGFDYRYMGKTTVLTKLRFRLKKADDGQYPAGLCESFDVTLYPNSVFLMPLSTNRLYTHETVPSNLPVARIPTRMGYVVRCSNTEAVSANGATFVVRRDDDDQDQDLVPLVVPTIEQVQHVKNLYKQENATTEVVHYKDIYFSLNTGDYKPPHI